MFRNNFTFFANEFGQFCQLQQRSAFIMHAMLYNMCVTNGKINTYSLQTFMMISCATRYGLVKSKRKRINESI